MPNPKSMERKSTKAGARGKKPQAAPVEPPNERAVDALWRGAEALYEAGRYLEAELRDSIKTKDTAAVSRESEALAKVLTAVRQLVKLPERCKRPDPVAAQGSRGALVAGILAGFGPQQRGGGPGGGDLLADGVGAVDRDEVGEARAS